MKREILELLRRTEEYVSGQEMCRLLGVSRTAIWKAMNQLKEEGYAIDAVPNKGYRLRSVPDVLSAEEMESRVNARTGWAGRRVCYYEELDSTNSRAKQLAEEGMPHGTLVLAGSQTAGKGRRGRQWTSPAGSGVFMTLILKPKIQPASASMLTLAAALAVKRAVSRLTGLTPLIKWPNDIVINGKKVCGILTEMSSEVDYINYVVVGIGINTNMEEFPGELEKTATSLLLETGQRCHRASLASAVLEEFEAVYERFLATEDLSDLKEEYEAGMVNLGRQVRVLAVENVFEGVAVGIDEGGRLLVETKDRVLHKVMSGEVSVRGIYGYV